MDSRLRENDRQNEMHQDIRLRKFKERDLQALQNLIYQTIDACYPVAYPAEAVEFFKNHHSEEHILDDATKGYTLVLESGGAMVGTGSRLGTNIRRVFIDPSRQNSGMGKAVMRELERQALKEKVLALDLEASLVSIQFYQSMGWEDQGERFIPLKNDQRLIYRKMTKNLVGMDSRLRGNDAKM